MLLEGDVKEEIVGKVFSTNKSGDCVVTKYVGCNEVYVKFNKSGFETKTSMSSLRNGTVKDKTQVKGGKTGGLITKEDVDDLFEIIDDEVCWKSTVSGKRAGKPILNKHKVVSIAGRVYHYEDVKGLVIGAHKEISPRSEAVPEMYTVWNAMQQRCKERCYPISEVFSKYETWIEWARKQKGFKELDFFNAPFNLDSDLFSNAVKTYSEDTCVFIPQHLNQIYKTSYKDNEMLGVDFVKGKYRARIHMFNSQVILGSYEAKEDAIKAYRNKRAEYVKLILNLHRHQLEAKTIKFLEYDIKNNIFI